MSGAIALAGMAALRAGAGLVTLAVPDVCLETVAAFDPCLMTVPLPCDSLGCLAEPPPRRRFSRWRPRRRGGVRPGLGRGPQVSTLVRSSTRRGPAAGGGCRRTQRAGRATGRTGAAGGPRIITPHPGEFRRLCGGDEQDRAGPDTCCRWRWRASTDRGRAQGPSHVDHRWSPVGPQHDGQSGHGDGRFGRRADRNHRRAAGQGLEPGMPRGWPCTCTAWRATWRPATDTDGLDGPRLVEFLPDGLEGTWGIDRAVVAWPTGRA